MLGPRVPEIVQSKWFCARGDRPAPRRGEGVKRDRDQFGDSRGWGNGIQSYKRLEMEVVRTYIVYIEPLAGVARLQAMHCQAAGRLEDFLMISASRPHLPRDQIA